MSDLKDNENELKLIKLKKSTILSLVQSDKRTIIKNYSKEKKLIKENHKSETFWRTLEILDKLSNYEDLQIQIITKRKCIVKTTYHVLIQNIKNKDGMW